MLKRSFILLASVGVSIVFAGQPEIVRESTIIYKLKEGSTAAELKSFNALINRNTIMEEKEIAGIQVKVVKVKGIKGLEKAFSKQLMDTGAVKFAEPDASVPHDETLPNDPKYSSQWHHITINSPLAWDHTTGSDGLGAVKVCVLDTGVDTDHPDLAGNLLLPGYNAYLKQDGNIEAVLAHGTETSGLVGAVGNNNIGVAGMAWNINIIPVKINFDEVTSSAYYSDMAFGITWCADQGVKVANLSYGGAHRPEIAEAAQYLRDRGGLLFMSAGNDGTNNSINDYPDYTSFVVVGATYQSDVKTSFSEYGPFVDVVAPGSYIYTTDMSTDGYGSHSGTSFSSPITAGLAALIYTVNPDFTPAEVESFIFSTAVDLGDTGDDDLYGHGRIDAGAAVVAAVDSLGTPNTPPVARADSNTTSGPAPLTVAFDGSRSTDYEGPIASYSWDFGDGSTGSGETATHIYDTEGNFNATLTVTDNRGAKDTSAPIAIQVDPDPSIVNAPSSLAATVDGNSVTLTWFYNSENEAGFEIFRAIKYRGKYIYDLTKPLITTDPNILIYLDEKVAIGDYRYKIRAKSASGSYSDLSNEVSVKVETSLPPEPEPEPDPEPGTLSAPVLSASISGLSVSLTWTNVCPEGSTCTYHIERGVGKNINQAVFDTTPIASTAGTSYVVTEESVGTYYYRVYVYVTESGNSSDYSNTVTARLK